MTQLGELWGRAGRGRAGRYMETHHRRMCYFLASFLNLLNLSPEVEISSSVSMVHYSEGLLDMIQSAGRPVRWKMMFCLVVSLVLG